MLTSNKSYGEWGEVFSGDTVIATAILDRLLHDSTTIPIKGESYRLKDRKKAGIVTTPAEGVSFQSSLTVNESGSTPTPVLSLVCADLTVAVSHHSLLPPDRCPPSPALLSGAFDLIWWAIVDGLGT